MMKLLSSTDFICNCVFFLTFPINYYTEGFTFGEALILMFVEKFSDFIDPWNYIFNNTFSVGITLSEVNSVHAFTPYLFNIN